MLHDVRESEPLKNIPYLAIWDRIPVGSFGAAFFFLICYILFTVFLNFVFGNPANQSNWNTSFGESRDGLVAIGLVWLLMLIYVLVVLARGLVADAKELAVYLQDEKRARALLENVTPTRKWVGIEIAIALIWAQYPVLVDLIQPLYAGSVAGLSDQLKAQAYLISVGDLTLFAFWTYYILVYVIFVHLLAFVFRLAWFSYQLAKEVPVRLARTESLVLFANPFLRSLLLMVANLVVLPGVYIISGYFDGEVNQFWPFVRAGAVSAALFVPLYVVFQRISAAKSEELKAIDKALAGNRDALGATMVKDNADSLSTFELLQYKELVQRMWVWPVGPQLQKIILIGLVPPLSWVLAALVEVYLSSAIE